MIPDHLILFDGVCNFCNSSVNFIIRHDKKNVFRFTPLQSEVAKKIAAERNTNTKKVDSILYLEKGVLHTKSTAVLKIAKQLGGVYKLCYTFIIVPGFIRDFFYDIIARNRYKWFGVKDSCMVPSQEIKEKFID